jgi:hypothetical protein
MPPPRVRSLAGSPLRASGSAQTSASCGSEILAGSAADLVAQKSANRRSANDANATIDIFVGLGVACATGNRDGCDRENK